MQGICSLTSLTFHLTRSICLYSDCLLLKNCIAMYAGIGVCICVCVYAHKDASHPKMKCILCLQSHYLDNNIHISSHLQCFITAL